MTKAQEMAVENLKNAFFKTFSYGRPDEREFKEVHVEYWEETETVYVRLEMGLIGDEGTMAAVFCTDSTTTCIGKKGGYFQHRPTTNKDADSAFVRRLIGAYIADSSWKIRIKRRSDCIWLLRKDVSDA